MPGICLLITWIQFSKLIRQSKQKCCTITEILLYLPIINVTLIFEFCKVKEMLFRLILLFTLVPLIELSLLIEIGRQIGLFSTIAIVIITGIIGAYLAKYEGFRVIYRIRQDMSQGRIPAEGLLDGVIILAGGLLLLTPGLITDVIGFLALIPLSRHYIKQYLKRKFKQKIDSREIYTYYTIDDE